MGSRGSDGLVPDPAQSRPALEGSTAQTSLACVKFAHTCFSLCPQVLTSGTSRLFEELSAAQQQTVPDFASYEINVLESRLHPAGRTFRTRFIC